MKWLITGANGQLGRCIQRTLDSKGIDYVSLSRADLDISNRTFVHECFSEIKPDVVINAAAYTNVEKAEEDQDSTFAINQIGAANVAVSSKLIGAKLVHFSTDYVFSGNRTSPWLTTDLTEPLSIYGKSKLAGELAVNNIYPENSLVIRTAWLYSPFGKNFYKTMLSKALNGNDSVSVVNDQFGQPTSALDLAALTVRAVESNASPGIFHGTNSGSCSWFDFAKYIFEIAGKDARRVNPVSSLEFPTKVRRPKYSVLDNQKWSESGIMPLGPWKDSVRDMLPDLLLQSAE